jgi:Cof subfamily protein (haloacid dehalogenase superfamily)
MAWVLGGKHFGSYTFEHWFDEELPKENQPVKMVVMDLDGTLLNKDKKITPYTLSILEKCRKKGIKIALATARSEKSAERYLDLVNPDYAILNSGALVMVGTEVIYKKKMSAETINGIIAELRQSEKSGEITVETDGTYYVSSDEPAWHEDYAHGVYYDFSQGLSEAGYKITAEIFDTHTAYDIRKKFPECRMTAFTGEGWYCFTHKDTEKSAAVEILANAVKIHLFEIAAFGDDYNDLKMIQKCGRGIAMANGVDIIKLAANDICGSCDDDGVAKWLEVHVLKA